MRGKIALGNLGHPVIVLVLDVFSMVAPIPARAQGMAALTIYMIHDARLGHHDEVAQEGKVAKFLEELI